MQTATKTGHLIAKNSMRSVHQGRIAKNHCTVISALSVPTEISDWDSIYYSLADSKFTDEKVESTDSKVDRFRNLR